MPALLDDFFSPHPTSLPSGEDRKKKRKRRGRRGGRRKQKTPQGTTSDTIKIFNLSSHILSMEETSILKKGLNFAPSSSRNPFVLFRDLNSL